jgi:uncharacterized protein YydD (DUF2326 family)
MIISITSSIPTFKSVAFQAGLNVLIADKTPTSTERQTRNSAGKTSLIEIVHFLFGSDCDKDSLFRSNALLAHTFTGSFRLNEGLFTVERGGEEPSRIYLRERPENTTLEIKEERATGRSYTSLLAWRAYLGSEFFRLPVDRSGTVFAPSGTPSYRSLFSYFVRRENAGGFLHPERNSEMQQRVDWQVNLSYLFRLDWEIPLAFQKVRDREKNLAELKKAAKSGALGSVVGTVAELRPKVTIAEKRATTLREQLAHFQVLDSYLELARHAAAITREAVSIQEVLQHLNEALESEVPTKQPDLQRLYAAAHVELPGVALRRLEDVESFHQSVLENRRTHLATQLSEAKEALRKGQERLGVLDNERSGILQQLAGRGALEDFLQIQKELVALEAEEANLRERFKTAEIMEGEATQLDIDRANLKRRLQGDYRERNDQLEESIVLIADLISTLYDDRAGRFLVEATNNGPEFRISIDGDRGGGISNMEIYCLDLTLLTLTSRHFGGPGFLIHDSHLFDGVDERQIAQALLVGHRVSSASNQQYIVTMNSDIFDRLPLLDDFDRSSIVLPVRISDETETGGLFGVRYG